MLTCSISSKNSLFDSEVARQYPPEDWLTLRVPSAATELIEALNAAVPPGGRSFGRPAGPLVQNFFISRDEMIGIFNAPSLAKREGLYALLDRYSLASGENLSESFCAAGISAEIPKAFLQDEVDSIRRAIPHTLSQSPDTIAKHVADCQPDKHLFLRPFLPLLHTRFEADALWKQRSNILMRHIRRDTKRQLAEGGKTHLNVAGYELQMFASTCRAIVFTIVQEAYWPMPDEMQADLDRMRADPDCRAIGWTRYPLFSFPDSISAAPSLEDELNLAGEVSVKRA